ncbi:uncharacterized protein LOC126969482 [Leptidea sinapis]|uniref:uncharacterized protein LOC126969482 n=1 Tax=Leptidea sinapis TaxID=189913 RepID=UPI0021C35F72|nr:uncharacterized protein LOC126969482 [Leptidea sinapis]XP_050670893.1 uncharacterized protein LOC126969482 [Leptidea sinapis]
MCETIYLWKETHRDIRIDNEEITKSQIDGVRFLFKEFKKKNLGVIINFPQKCGKSTTAAFFVYAVRDLLEQPVLILCKDVEQIQHWQLTFNKWTQFNDDDIAVEPTNAFVKKKIFIKSMTNITSFCKRSWSIVIVKDDDYFNIPLMPNAGFKIWVTSTDVKKDRKLLSFIHKWIYPKDVVSFDDFEGNYEKQIIFDTFLEDFVLRLNKMQPYEVSEQMGIVEENVPIKRKNKDITGKKIKRSKVVIKKEEPSRKYNEITDDSAPSFIADKKSNDFNIDKDIDKKALINNSSIENKIENNYNEDTVRNVSPNIFSTNSMNDLEINIQTHNKKERDMAVVEIAEGNVHESGVIVEDTQQRERKCVDLDTTNNNQIESLEVDSVDILAENTILPNRTVKNLKSDIDDTHIEKHDTNESNSIEKDEIRNSKANLDKKVPVPNNSKSTCDLDSKLNEFEEQAMKKFKGSFLDNLF